MWGPSAPPTPQALKEKALVVVLVCLHQVRGDLGGARGGGDRSTRCVRARACAALSCLYSSDFQKVCLFRRRLERSYTYWGRGERDAGRRFFLCTYVALAHARRELSLSFAQSYRGRLTRNARDTPLYTRRRDAASLNYTQQRCAGVRGDLGLFWWLRLSQWPAGPKTSRAPSIGNGQWPARSCRPVRALPSLPRRPAPPTRTCARLAAPRGRGSPSL